MKRTCVVEKVLWGNTDNVWKPVKKYEFNSYSECRNFLLELKTEPFSYLHKINIYYNIENI